MTHPAGPAPRILITAGDPSHDPEPGLVDARYRLYAEAVARHGAEPRVLHAGEPAADRTAALAAMDGLLLAGGTDIDPARYGRTDEGSAGIERDRDELEAAAWAAAEEQDLPVLGICRGLQAINVFAGGTLVQDVDGHRGNLFGHGPPKEHPLRVVPGTRLARILFPTNVRGGVLPVNSYHHQGVTAAGLAPGLVAAGWSPSPAGDLVEALETRSGRFVIGVQCHPERTEFTPAAFERLFRVFVDAARGAVTGRGGPARR